MTEYRQYPDPAPRGRHARQEQQAGGQPAPQGGRPQQPRQPQQQRPQRQPRQPQPQQPQRQPQSRQQQQRQPQQPGQAPHRGQQPGQAAHSAQAGAYRPVQQGAYRPVAPQGAASGRPAGPAGPRGAQGAPARKKGGPWKVVFWGALVVLAVALIALGAIGFSYWQGQKAYDDVAGQAFEAPTDVEGTSLADMTVDWDALKAINPDTVGWIYIPGTAVNYPIVHTTDDQKYLTHDFQGSEGWIATFGAIFLSAANAADFSDANNIVYGHHLNNGSMFAAIAGFDDAAQFNSHRTVYILTPQGNYRLASFSLVHCAADDPLVQTAFSSDADRTAYMQDKIDRSTVKPDGDVPAAADITRAFAFATCDNLPSDGRYVLFCSLAESTVAGVSGTASGDGSVNPDDAAAVGDAVKEAA